MRSENVIAPTESLLRIISEKRVYAAYLVVACAALGVAAIGWPVLKNQGFPLDDSWIYQVIGRNAARFGVPGFSPGVATAGSSSAIWPWIIAINHRLLPSVSPTVYLLLINSLCFLALLFVLFSAAVRDGLRSLDVVLLAALPAITGNLAWLLSTGMEHLLFISTVFLAAHFWLSTTPGRNATQSILAGTLCGLTIATRPEAVVFLPLFLGAGWWFGRCRRDLALFVVPCVVFVALVELNNLWASHSLMLATFSGRKWMFLADTHASPMLLVLRLLGAWALQIITFFIGVEHTPGSLIYKVTVIVVCIALLMGLFRLIHFKAWRTLFLVSLAVINFLVYCVILPAPGQGMRYQAMTLVFIFPLLALGALEILEQLPAERRGLPHLPALLQALVVTSIFVLALSSLLSWSQITEFGIRHINGTQVRMGRWLADHVPAGTPVASFDIGGIGYFGNVRVIDLGGLTDPTFIPNLYAGTSAEFLKRQRVQLLVVSASGTMRTAAMQNHGDVDDSRYCDGMTERLNLCDGAELHKKYVVSFSTPSNIWDRGFRATLHADQSQVLYKIIWK